MVHRSFSSALGRIATVLTICFLASSTLWAQKDASSLSGTVKDSTGAVIAGAAVTVVDLERGSKMSTTTNIEGGYVVTPLKVGQYQITVEKQGFKKTVAGPVTLQVQQRAVLDLSMEIGSLSQEVMVTSEAKQLETETSELGQVVDGEQMKTLPLNGRNFAQLALLSAGTAPSEPGSRDESSYGFSSNGGRSLQNNFLLDGVDNNSNLTDLLNGSNFVIQPPVDAIQEFKVQTNSYSAEFGRGNGAIINAVIKSGTNQLHGSAWEFFRNRKLDARNYFDQVALGPKPQFDQNQFGGTLGGPVYIPKLYDGRNKTFFFVDYEGLRIRAAQPQTATVPTAAQLNGDFSANIDYTSPTGVNDCNGVPTYAGEIFNTRLTQAVGGSGYCGVPFGYDANGLPTNIIPTSMFDPLALRIASLYPAPNVNGNGYNFQFDPIKRTTRNNVDVRIDQKISGADNIFGRFSYQDQPSTIPPNLPGIADGGGFYSGIEDDAARSVAVSETHVFRTNLINEARFGYNRLNSQRLQFNYNQDLSGQLGFPGVPFVATNGGLPQLTFSDVSQIGSPTYLPSHEIQNTYTFSDNLSWVRGNHSLKFGTEIRFEQFSIFQPAAPRGTLDFGNVFTDNPGAQGSGGSGFASFLLGLPDGGSINNLNNIQYRRPVYAFYTQDDWKVTQKLTLNLGLRYELFSTVKEASNNQGTFDIATNTLYIPKGNQAQLTPYFASLFGLSATATPGLVKPDTNNFAPRVGLAYSITDKLVMRAGFGIFYGGEENGPYSNPSPGFSPPFFTTQAFNMPCGLSSANPALSASGANCAIPGLTNAAGQMPGSGGISSQGFPATSLTDPNTPQLFHLDKNLVTPYMEQWQWSFQYQLPANTVLEAAYAGSRGEKLYLYLNGNQAAPNPDPTVAYAVRRPDPAIDSAIPWVRTGGRSNYNSLQLRAEKTTGSGLAFSVAYTYAHSLDDASSANLGAQNGGDFRYFMYPQLEYGNSDFDVRHRFVASYAYQLPFGRGRKFGSGWNRSLNGMLGQWQIAGVTAVQSGNWFTITDGNGNFSNSDGQQRPDLVGNPNSTPCVPGTYFNTCAFADPPASAYGTLAGFGNAGRNIVRGPGYQSWDMSFIKLIPVSESKRFEFRTELFNFLNHPNLQFAQSGPQNSINTTTFGTPQFGYLTAARPPRQIQLALKFYF
jgi:Carboxypeptidase regulatory-like domain/TonB dependent receptor-like, beta-barrel